MNKTITALYMDLKNYGLNPYDWIITRQWKSKSLELSHIDMPELKMRGQTKRKGDRWQWQFLEFIEL